MQPTIAAVSNRCDVTLPAAAAGRSGDLPAAASGGGTKAALPAADAVKAGTDSGPVPDQQGVMNSELQAEFQGLSLFEEVRSL
jgi:hypothetical protein